MKLPRKIVNTAVCAAIIGVIFITSGIVLISLRSWFLNVIIKSLFTLAPNSRLLENWQKSPESLYTDFYFFNWTNSDDIFEKHRKPSFREIGPYRFRQVREMVNLTWNDNSTITYRQLRYWYFDEAKSKGRLTDRITTLNPILMSAADQYDNWNSFMKKEFLLSMATAESHLHVTKTVSEFLFEGYEDPYVVLAQKLPFLYHTLPAKGKFGWFYGKNGSYTHDGVFNMETGADKTTIGKLSLINYQDQLPFQTFECDNPHGSASGLFPPRSNEDSISLYYPEVCRYLTLDYDRDAIASNFAGNKYIALAGLLDNGPFVQQNRCQCSDACSPSGIFNISSCKSGIPTYASLPHFYKADPMYLSKVDGLHPEKSKHEMYITLEPRSGATLSIAIRLQYNIHLHPVENITLFKQVPYIYVPVLWYEEKENISADFASTMKIMFKLPIACTVIAIVEIFVGIYLLYFARKRHRSESFYTKSNSRKNVKFEEVPLHNDMDGPYCSTTVDAADYLEVLNDEYDDEEEMLNKD